MTRPTVFICATLALSLVLPGHADTGLDNLARDLERVESIRAVKNLQAAYSQYAQFGLWNEVGGLDCLGSGPLNRAYQASDGWVFIAAQVAEIARSTVPRIVYAS